MPILRMPADNTMAETLGNLGSQLATNLSPKTAAEAQLLMRNIWLKNLELMKQQREMQAQDAAVRAYGPLVGNDPNALAMIRQGILGGMNQKDVLELAIRVAPDQWDHSGTDAAAQHNMARVQALTGQVWDKPYPPVVDAASLKVKNDTETRLAGEKAGSEALGKGSAEQALRTYNWEDTPWDPASVQRNAQAYFRIKGEMPANGLVPGAGPATDQTIRDVSAGTALADAAAKARGTALGGGEKGKFPEAGALPPVPGAPTLPTKPFTPGEPSGVSSQPLPTPGQQPPPAPGQQPPPVPGQQPPPAPDQKGPSRTMIPSTLPGRYALPTTFQTNVPGAGVSIGEDPNAALANEVTKDRYATLTKDIGQGEAAAVLKTKLTEIKALSDYINNQGVVPQAVNSIIGAIGDRYKVHIGSVGAAQEALDNIYRTELPDILKAAGAQARGPEIMTFKVIPGDPSMPRDTVNDIIARQMAVADQQVQRGREALNVRDNSNSPIDWDGYMQNNIQRQNDLAQAIQKFQTDFSSIGAQVVPQAQPQQPFEPKTVAPAAPAAPATPAPAAPAPPAGPAPAPVTNVTRDPYGRLQFNIPAPATPPGP